MWWLVLVLAVGALGEECTRARIIACATAYADANSDGTITAAEWSVFTTQSQCGALAPQITPASLMAACDQTGDGALTAADYDHPYSCMRSAALRTSVCLLCDACDGAA